MPKISKLPSHTSLSSSDLFPVVDSSTTATKKITADNMKTFFNSGVDADTVDTYHASQTPTADTIPVADSTGKIDSGWLPSTLDADTISADSIIDGSTNKVYTSTEKNKLSGISSGADVTLSAINGGLTVTGGGITLSSGGSIKGGQTAYDTGKGFFLGYSDSAYKFSIGDGTYTLKWDGTDLIWNGKGKTLASGETDISALSLTLYGVRDHDSHSYVSSVSLGREVKSGYYLNVSYGTCYHSFVPYIYINTGISETPPSPWNTASNKAYGCRAQAAGGHRNASHNQVYWFITAELAQVTGFWTGSAQTITSYGQDWSAYNIGIKVSVECLNYLPGDEITDVGWALMSV